jgi:hypothetical protein
MLALAWLALFTAAAYTAPAVLAYYRQLPGTRKIVAINLFFGWTLAGWVIALVMAVRGNPARDDNASGKGLPSAVLARAQEPDAPAEHLPGLPRPCAMAPACQRACMLENWYSPN